MTDNRRVRCWAEVSLDAISHNYRTLQSRVGGSCNVVCIVKADAYGHGSVEVAKHLESVGATFFAVATIPEAIDLRDAGIKSDILVLGYSSVRELYHAMRYNITVAVVSEAAASEYNSAVPAEKKLRCHLKIDTGMSRFGVPGTELNISAYPNLQFEGVFTHLPVSDELSPESIEYTKIEIENFRHIAGYYNLPFSHCANSGAVASHPDSYAAPFNLVRPGIALYGHYDGLDLIPVMRLFTRIFQIHSVKPGDSVGYGQTWQALRDSKIAVLGIGYADGYRRALSNIGEVYINGCNAPIVGRVCMDLTMIDVTDVPNVEVGDIVEMFGENIKLESLAQKAGTITYELLTNVGKRVPRIYI